MGGFNWEELFISAPSTVFLIGRRSVSPPVHACPDPPAASHSGLGAGGLTGWSLDWTHVLSIVFSFTFVWTSHSYTCLLWEHGAHVCFFFFGSVAQVSVFQFPMHSAVLFCVVTFLKPSSGTLDLTKLCFLPKLDPRPKLQKPPRFLTVIQPAVCSRSAASTRHLTTCLFLFLRFCLHSDHSIVGSNKRRGVNLFKRYHSDLPSILSNCPQHYLTNSLLAFFIGFHLAAISYCTLKSN